MITIFREHAYYAPCMCFTRTIWPEQGRNTHIYLNVVIYKQLGNE